MASIGQRNGSWQPRVIRKGHAPFAKTFDTRQDAERWARGMEADMERGIERPATTTAIPPGMTIYVPAERTEQWRKIKRPGAVSPERFRQ